MINFQNDSSLGGVVNSCLPFCLLQANKPIVDYRQITGDFHNPYKFPGLAANKWAHLCGFSFTSKLDGALFAFVYVPKMKGSFTRNDMGLSGWYCWMLKNPKSPQGDRIVLSIDDTMKRFGFDINRFVFSDVFNKNLQIFKQHISIALYGRGTTPGHVQVFLDKLKDEASPNYRLTQDYVNAVKASLNTIEDVKQICKDAPTVKVYQMLDKKTDQLHGVEVPQWGTTSRAQVGQAKVAYNANKTYELRDLDKEKHDKRQQAIEQLNAMRKQGGTIANESVIDFPKGSLHKAIWQSVSRKDKKKTFKLTKKAERKVQHIVNWFKQTFKIDDVNVRIVGSITSNQYSKNSDIDIHFSSDQIKKSDADEFNRKLKSKFKSFIERNPRYAYIDDVKTEVYFQPNEYQDMMSCGCYDFNTKRWIVKPDIKGKTFNPYKKFIKKDIKNIDNKFSELRSLILKLYEYAFLYLKSKDQSSKNEMSKQLDKCIAKTGRMFSKIRSFRKAQSTPKNKKEADKLRNDKKWLEVNSTFKLLDKFGYIPILHQITGIDLEDINYDKTAKEIIELIHDKLSPEQLVDSELPIYEDELNEGARLFTLSMIASLMAIPNILLAKDLGHNLKLAATHVPQQVFTVKNPEVKKAIVDSGKSQKQLGGMSITNVANVLAQLLWKEARGESSAGREAIASVIWNRANGDPNCFVDVVKEKGAFTCFKKITWGWTDKDYVFFVPKQALDNPANAQIWEECKDLASKLIQKNFTSTIGNNNSYLNKKTADKDAVQTWGTKCTLKIGKHHFGYLREHDPKFVKPGTMIPWRKFKKKQLTPAKRPQPVIVTVKAGDTLYDIAKKNKVSINDILKLNAGINPKALKIGQKIRIA